MSAISQIEIYKPDGTQAVVTTIADTSQRVRKIMAENYIQIDFVSPTYVDIPIGSTISYEGYRYVKTRRQTPTYNGAWQYSEQFDDADGFMRTRRIKYYGQDFQEMSFALTATLRDFAELVVKDVNKEREGARHRQDWTVGAIDAALEDTLKTISFNGDTLFDACTAIAQEYETEWYITKYYVSSGGGYEVIELNFRKKEDGSEISFEAGSGKVLNAMNPQRGEDSEYGTRFFVFGGTRNLTEEYKEVPAGSSVPNLYENRLHLPDNQAYIDAKNGQIVSNLGHNEVLEQYVTFDDIYPKNRDIITGVSSQVVEDEQGNQYREYTIQADDCPFAGKGDIIDTLGIKFETGELAGQEFEARLETEQLPWNKRLIIVAENLGTDGQVLYVPNEQIKPSVGDVFVLTGVKLPSSKIADAEQELLAKAEDYAKQHSTDTDVYECISNNVYCYENSIGYDIGTKVKLVSQSLFGADGRSSRIQSVVFSLTKPYEITWEVGDNTKYSRFGAVSTTLEEVKYSQRLGIIDTSLLNLIRSEDYQSPSDENIYTALAAYNHIYKKHDHRGRLIRPAVFVVPTQGPAAAGFSLDDNEVAFWCDTLGNYAETPGGGGGGGGELLTVTKNGQTWLSYDGSQAVTLNLVVPTKVSDLDNDSGFLTASTLPIASANTLGGIKVGNNLTIDANGVLSAANSYVLPTASSSVKGGIKVGNTLTISNEVLNVVVGSVAQSNTGFVTGGDVYSAIAAAVTSALHYRGMSSTALTDGGTETAIIGGVALVPQSGDVVIYNGFEFLWENSVWNKLGDDSSYALKTIQISAGTGLTGGGDLTASRTLSLSSATQTDIGKGVTAYNSLGNYLPLAGNSTSSYVTGPVYFDAGNNSCVIKNIFYNTTTGWSRDVVRLAVDGTNKFTIGAYGSYIQGGSSNGLEYAYIGCNAYNGLNLRITSDSLKWGSNVIYHAGNLTKSVLTTILDSDGGYYLKLTGGTLTGTLNARDILPSATTTYALGSSSKKWNEVWGAKAHISSLLAIPTAAPASGSIVSGEAYLYSSTGSYAETPGGGVADVYPLTITKNGSAWLYYNPGTQAESINLVIPTKVSDLTNDTGFITASSIPSTYAWSAITNTPTTLSGYGITDAKIETPSGTTNKKITLGSNNFTIYSWALASSKPSYAFSDLTAHPTTISGYGITDAKIANGVITLGSNSITPITSSDHKALTLKVGSTTIGSDYNALAAKTYTITAQNITDAIGSTTYAPYNANGYVPTTRKVNNKALSSDITLSLDDVADGSTRKLANYLPLAGGTMTGDIILTNGKFIRESSGNNAILGINSGSFIAGSPGHPAIIRTDASNITHRTPTANYTIWDSGNFNPANYLALTGGTMSNTNLVTNLNADLLDGKHASDILTGIETLKVTTESDATFTYRAVPSVAVGDVARVTKVEGKTIVWNQMILQGNFSSGSTWSATKGSASISDNTITFTGDTSTSTSKGFVGYGSPSTVVIGHKYYIAITLKGEVATTVRFAHALNSGNSLYSLMNVTVTTSWTRTSAIWNNTDLAPAAFYPAIRWIDTTNNVSKSIYAKDYVLIDLTLMFGAGNEPSTVAEFEALYPEVFYSYNTGELVSNKAEALETRDASDNILDTLPLNLSKMVNAANPNLKFNQWAKAYDSSDYAVLTYTSKSTDTTTEELVVTSSNSSSAVKGVKLNNVTFVSGHKYYINANFTSGANVGLYQSNGGYVIRTTVSGAGVIGTATSSVAYFGCRLPNGAASGASYRFKNMMCVDLTEMYGEGNEPTDPHIVEELVGVRSYTEGEYMPNYIFPKGMKGCGTASDEASGKKATRRFDIVDLGSLSWAYTSGQFISTGLVGLVKEPADGGVVPNIISTKYTATSYGSFGDKQMIIIFAGSSSHGRLYIKDSSYTDVTTFAAAVVGTKLIFELATPIEYDLETAVPELIECDVLGTQRRLPEDTASSVQAPFHCDFQYGANPGEIVSDSAYRYLPLAGGTVYGTLEASGELIIPDHAPYQPELNKHYLYVNDNGNYYQS